MTVLRRSRSRGWKVSQCESSPQETAAPASYPSERKTCNEKTTDAGLAVCTGSRSSQQAVGARQGQAPPAGDVGAVVSVSGQQEEWAGADSAAVATSEKSTGCTPVRKLTSKQACKIKLAILRLEKNTALLTRAAETTLRLSHNRRPSLSSHSLRRCTSAAHRRVRLKTVPFAPQRQRTV